MSSRLLTGKQIRQKDLISNTSEKCFRSASYDLRVGRVVYLEDSQPRTKKGSYVLQPHGMVKVVSEEILELPPDVVAYALVKNVLSNAGVLAINIGIIDPKYSGPIASTLINFGSSPFHLSPGEAFLRLTFHERESDEPAGEHLRYEYKEYLDKTEKEVLQLGSNSFSILSYLSQK